MYRNEEILVCMHKQFHSKETDHKHFEKPTKYTVKLLMNEV